MRPTLLILLAACSRPPAPVFTEPEPAETPWCVASVVVDGKGESHPVTVCTDEEDFCAENRPRVVRLVRNPFVRVMAEVRLEVVGMCGYRGGRD